MRAVDKYEYRRGFKLPMRPDSAGHYTSYRDQGRTPIQST